MNANCATRWHASLRILSKSFVLEQIAVECLNYYTVKSLVGGPSSAIIDRKVEGLGEIFMESRSNVVPSSFFSKASPPRLAAIQKISSEVRQPAEFKHIIKRRKRN